MRLRVATTSRRVALGRVYRCRVAQSPSHAALAADALSDDNVDDSTTDNTDREGSDAHG